MSDGSRVIVLDDETYRINRERLDRMQQYINVASAANEQGKRNFDQLASELERKIQEGEEAKRLLASIKSQATQQPLLTYHDSESSNPHLPLLSYPPGHVDPPPSARIEEVPSPPHHRQHTSYHTDYAGTSYQPQHRGYEQQRLSSYQNQQTPQNAPGSSTLVGALGERPQAHQNGYAYAAAQQSSSRPQTYSQPSHTLPYIPPQAFQSDSRPQPQSSGSGQQRYSVAPQRDSHTPGAQQQLNSGMQTQQSRPSEDRAQSSQQQSGAQPNSGAQFQSRPPATTHSQAAPASETLSFGTASKLDQRQSRPPEMSSSAPPAPPQKQTHPQPSVPPAQQSRPDQPQSRPPVVPSSAPLEQPQKQTHPQSVPPAQQSRPDRRQPVVPLSAPPEQPQRQIHPQSSAPSAQLNSQPILQPQSQRGPSMQANHESHARPPPTAQPNARLPQTRPTQAQAPPSIPPPQSTSQSLNSQQGGTASQRKETQPSTQLNPPPAPSYGISPFAYVAATSKVPALPKPADSLQPLPSANQYAAFTKLIDIWQKTSLTEDILDIPHAQIRVLKNPKGEIFFLYGATRISAMAAFSRLQFKGMASIFINTAGIKTLLSDPPPQEVAATHKRFEAAQVPGAPQATFPEPPLAPAKRVSVQTRTPHDADKRFLAHDVLRALGKGQMYAPEEDSVRYAKRRAVEAPAPAPATGAPVPFVAWPIQPVRSNESSAKTTPEPQAPSVPIAQVARRALTGPQVPLFMPPDTSPPPVPAPAKARIQSLPASTARANCYVLVPPAPAYVRRHQEKMRAQREQEAMQVVEPEVLKEEEEEEEEIDLKELKRQRARGMYQNTEDGAQAAAMLEAVTRIGEAPCNWFECREVLNSVESLVVHLSEVHAQGDPDMLTCMWNLCGETFSDSERLVVHAETHVLETISCAYQDCDEMFRTPRELVAHNLGHAEQNSTLKPSARPSAPEEPLPTPELAEGIPGWALLAPAIQMPDIPKDRHMTLGPWVLRNICAPAKLRAKRYNAALPLSGVKSYQPDYEFLETSSMHYSCLPSRPARIREMADISSTEVSDLLAKGQMVLWPPEGAEHQINSDAKPSAVEVGSAEEEMAVEGMLQADL